MFAGKNKRTRKMIGLAAVAAAAAATSAMAGTSYRDDPTNNVPAVTITLSGSTAMKAFTTSSGFSFLTPGQSITLDVGPSSPTTFNAPTGATFQLAQGDFLAGETTNGASLSYKVLRLEWHEQGSIEGILELADSQVNDYIYKNDVYNASKNNPTWVNRNSFTNAGTITGHTLANHTNDYTARAANGLGKVQMAISDVNATQGFRTRNSNAGNAAFNRAPEIGRAHV